jgi:hypothetical protein
MGSLGVDVGAGRLPGFPYWLWGAGPLELLAAVAAGHQADPDRAGAASGQQRAGAYRVYADPADLLARADELGIRGLPLGA